MAKQISGFQNIGNTCYMNSTLQALLSSKYITKLISENNENASELMKEYYKIQKTLEKSDNVIRPSSFKKVLGKVNKNFNNSRQHDANDLLLTILNDFVDNTKDDKLKNKLKKIYYGDYNQYLECDECEKSSETKQDFLDLLLPIPKSKDPNLRDCMELLCDWEVIEEKYCEKCKKNCNTHKIIEINKLPNVLIITFNRFDMMTKNNKNVKIFKNVNIDGEKFNLVATVNHSGGFGGGHYTGYASRVIKNKRVWYNANDSSISEIKDIKKHLDDRRIYIAIYEKV
jgi:ubiquitin C-terminal hydrolase